MIKANSIGLEKVDYNKNIFAEVEEQKVRFLQDIKEHREQELFEKLNVPQKHTKEELIALMRYKGKNIKAHICPSIFFEVAEMLEEHNEEHNND